MAFPSISAGHALPGRRHGCLLDGPLALRRGALLRTLTWAGAGRPARLGGPLALRRGLLLRALAWVGAVRLPGCAGR